MPEDPPYIPPDDNESMGDNPMEQDPQRNREDARGSSDVDLDAKARQWLEAQIARLGQDSDLVPYLSREEVDETVSTDDLEALTSYVSGRLQTTSLRTDREPQPGEASKKPRDVRLVWFARVAALLAVVLTGIWGGGRLTAPATQALASVERFEDELALLRAPPSLVVKQGGRSGYGDLRRGIQALQEAAPSPIAPVPRYDAERASAAAVALADAHRAFSDAPPDQPAPLPRREEGSSAYPDRLDTMHDLASFAAVLTAKAFLMQNNPHTAREWLQRVAPTSPWSTEAEALLDEIRTLSHIDLPQSEQENSTHDGGQEDSLHIVVRSSPLLN